MRSFSRLPFIPIVALSLLSACGETSVTSEHVRVATEKCEANGGWVQIDKAVKFPEYESCGSKCRRQLSTASYAVAFSCKNGAKFDLSWRE